jgi:hypothetical protein
MKREFVDVPTGTNFSFRSRPQTVKREKENHDELE